MFIISNGSMSLLIMAQKMFCQPLLVMVILSLLIMVDKSPLVPNCLTIFFPSLQTSKSPPHHLFPPPGASIPHHAPPGGSPLLVPHAPPIDSPSQSPMLPLAWSSLSMPICPPYMPPSHPLLLSIAGKTSLHYHTAILVALALHHHHSCSPVLHPHPHITIPELVSCPRAIILFSHCCPCATVHSRASVRAH